MSTTNDDVLACLELSVLYVSVRSLPFQSKEIANASNFRERRRKNEATPACRVEFKLYFMVPTQPESASCNGSGIEFSVLKTQSQ